MTDLFVSLLVEGTLDEVILRHLLKRNSNLNIQACFGKQGKQFLQKRIGNYNAAAAHTPFICLVDLDDDECPIELINLWLPEGRDRNLIVRIAVREVESWLLADRGAFAQYMGVNLAKISAYPDDVADPKQLVINLARQSRIKRIRQNIVPLPDSTSSVGKAYFSELIAFTLQKWDIERASVNSPSLERALKAFDNFATQAE